MLKKYALNTFDCQNLGDYHDIYLATDVRLLADIFKIFRSTAWYYTLPGSVTGVWVHCPVVYD